jgi:hypothetical protein
MRELKRTVGRSPDGDEGLKAAVADYFASKVSSVNPGAVSEGTQSINFRSLVREFNKNERTLAAAYSPEEMNALRRAQKMLEPLANLSGPSALRSPEGGGNDMALKMLEVGLKGYYGMLKGGGVFRTLKVAMSLRTENPAALERLVSRMMFDPELAAHLLTREVRDVASPAWNRRLAKLLRRTEAGRELLLDEGDDEAPTPLTFSVKPSGQLPAAAMR